MGGEPTEPEGFLDGVGRTVTGWAWLPGGPGRRLRVVVLFDGHPVETVADRYRADPGGLTDWRGSVQSLRPTPPLGPSARPLRSALCGAVPSAVLFGCGLGRRREMLQKGLGPRLAERRRPFQP